MTTVSQELQRSMVGEDIACCRAPALVGRQQTYAIGGTITVTIAITTGTSSSQQHTAAMQSRAKLRLWKRQDRFKEA